MVEDTYGAQSIKLPAGHMILYPATSLHHVRPVAKGARVASFFWVQSMVRDDGRRTILFDLDVAIQRLNADHPDHPSADSAHRRLSQPAAAVGGGLMVRKIFFWLHLTAGSLAGIVILIMSVTGVLLAWQRQIIRFADRRVSTTRQSHRMRA